jgi:hypothetical protein
VKETKRGKAQKECREQKNISNIKGLFHVIDFKKF